ncbi:YolD-like family protein [Bacillus pumilus]|uniref:YolD-like family protein n=1 Tax=Bacillus pumilus TaxID=1408 RepID=UPI0011AA0C5A|nr:YolD-like family protein [Bacillus pumilus]
MMLPEHVARLKQDLAVTKKTDKPIIDEQQAEEFEVTIAYAMSVNNPLIFSIFMIQELSINLKVSHNTSIR